MLSQHSCVRMFEIGTDMPTPLCGEGMPPHTLEFGLTVRRWCEARREGGLRGDRMESAGRWDVGRAGAGVQRAAAGGTFDRIAWQLGEALYWLAGRRGSALGAVAGRAAARFASCAAAVSDVTAIGRAVGAAVHTFAALAGVAATAAAVEAEQVSECAAVAAVLRRDAADGRR